MDELGKILAQYGPLSAVIGALLYMIYGLQSKLFAIVENNTRALEQLRSIIEKCQISHNH